MNPATAHLSLHACPRRLGTNARRCCRPLSVPVPAMAQTLTQGPGMRAGSEPIGLGGFTRYGQQDWDDTQDQLIAGQQTALGLSIQGISQAQLSQLKTRMEATQQKLQQAQAAPESQRAAILQGMTGENLTGDLLTATVWGYFASLQSHGAIASTQAQMFDRPALSYGLFHAQVRPNKLYGIVTTGISFQGLNMDIGHLRHIRWVKDDDPQAAINNKPELTANGKPAAQNRWIAYNKMRGQYSSAMEHAVPEQFWVDKTQCRYQDETGTIQNPTLADCAQGISAVKAIAIAQAQGQKIYTINQSNAATALATLPVGGDVGAEIRSAIQAGKEVTVHEKPISAHGWTGYGYTITDPETGAGAYIIEGRGNGGVLGNWESNGIAFSAAVGMLAIFATFIGASAPLVLIFFLVSVLFLFLNLMVFNLQRLEAGCKSADSAASIISDIFGIVVGTQGMQGSIFSLLWGIFFAKASEKNLSECRS